MDADNTLIKRMKQGDEAAFDAFVHKYYSDILRYCTYHCSDREEAKDLTQETFLKFFSCFDEYVHRNKAKNFLYTIARNLCKNYNKKAKRESMEEFNEESISEGLEYELNVKMTIRTCLDQLPEELREVIILYYYQDLKQTEIADVLKIGLPLVKYRLKKAKEQMKKILEQEG